MITFREVMKNVILPPLDLEKKCIKCGSEDISVYFQEGDVCPHNASNYCYCSQDSMMRTCQRCKFQWVEAPLLEPKEEQELVGTIVDPEKYPKFYETPAPEEWALQSIAFKQVDERSWDGKTIFIPPHTQEDDGSTSDSTG